MIRSLRRQIEEQSRSGRLLLILNSGDEMKGRD